MSIYTTHFNTKKTPQNQPIPGKKMARNSAGGYAFAIDDFARLERFLILGSAGGTYYATEQKHTVENAECVLRCLEADGLRTVSEIVRISHGGEGIKNDPAVWALAVALKQGDLDTRRAAAEAVPKVCRIGTHIFQLAEAIQSLGGWGRLTAKAFANYYTSKDADRLALDLFKYQQREGWSHKDILAKAHVGRLDQDKGRQRLYRYVVCDGKLGSRKVIRQDKKGLVFSEGRYSRMYKKDLPRFVEGVEKAKLSGSPKETAKLVVEYGLPRECVRTEHLNDVKVWDALLQSGRGMPLTAMIRNLGKMTSIGLLSPMSDATKYVVNRLKDDEAYIRARVHPMSVLLALRTYQQGRGMRGSLTWSPEQKIIQSLDKGFYKAFKAVEPTGLNWLLALDVSGSMGVGVSGLPISCRDASAALALVTMNTEEWTRTIGVITGRGARNGYGNGVTKLPLTASQSLQEAIRTVSGLPFGGTDCAQPMLYAMQNKLPVDVFVVYTDSETWANPAMHPCQALNEYRQKMGRPAKVIVVGMVSNGFSIADPEDPGMLDVVGFGTSVPQAMASFAKSGS